MARPSKSIGKNTNSKFTTRNNKQEIFSRIAKSSKIKDESQKDKEDNKTELKDRDIEEN